MEIAKGITSDDYNKLHLANYNNSDWQIAFDYLDKRLTERYIEPIEVLRAFEKDRSANDKKYGFTILAIDCLLIETIESFYEGVVDSSGHSRELFTNFLTQRENFKDFFPILDLANEFYINFRCGILHQAQTFGNTKVWSVGQLIMKPGKYLIVNRDAFHEAVVKEKNIYLDLLSKRTDNLLLENFKKKMNFIASA